MTVEGKGLEAEACLALSSSIKEGTMARDSRGTRRIAQDVREMNWSR